jgi:hypothetical protein
MNAAQELQVIMDERERNFESDVRDYLMDNGSNEFGDGRRFRFGGAHNLVATVRKAFENAYEETGIMAYSDVAEALTEVEKVADVDYGDAREAA